MNKKQLKARGGIVATAPVKKEIRWKHQDDQTGEEVEDVFDVHIKKLSFGMVEMALQPHLGLGQRAGKAALIAEAILLGDGSDPAERFTYEEAFQLKPTLAYQLYRAIADVNSLPVPKAPKSDDPSDADEQQEKEDLTDPKA